MKCICFVLSIDSVCVCCSDLFSRLESIEEQIGRQRQILREATAKYQVSNCLFGGESINISHTRNRIYFVM